MSASAEGLQSSLWDLNLPPGVSGTVELPQVVKLVVVVVLATIHVQLIVVCGTAE